jgi:aldehyde dehydrogenase (NAD+)
MLPLMMEKIVASAAAKTLTPVVLELGGKCPCIVDETCPSDIAMVANRIVWAKTVNCGQNCISPDYVLVHKSKSDALLLELPKALEKQFGIDPKQSGLGKLVAPGHVKRAIELLEEVEELAKTDKKIQILVGGSKECDVKTGYVAPTIILSPPLDCRVMQEEIFSPILAIVVVESRDEAVRIVNSRPGTPLALYAFTTRGKVFEELTERCRSGGAVRNDMMVHFMGCAMPFGGLGSSGMGSYRGAESFRVFSHMLPTIYRPCVPGADLNSMRCQPLASWKEFAILQVAPMLPSLPVLTTPLRIIFAAILAVAAARFMPGSNALILSARLTVADWLRLAATALTP